MKKYLIIVLLLVVGLETSAQQAILNNLSLAMKAGSSRELALHFHETIEINIDGEKSNYSRAQAEAVMKKFFEKHEAVSFSYIHEGASREGLSYTIGKFTHKKGSFRVVMFIKKFGDKFQVDTFNLSKE